MEHQVLVIAPHPDDEVLGCGGSIAKLTVAGARVYVGYLTSGEQGSGEIPAGELGLLREREARAAVSVLGVDPDEASFLRIGDGAIDPHDLAQVEAVIRLVRQIRPALTYLPHEHDGSFDHQAAHQLAVRALDPELRAPGRPTLGAGSAGLRGLVADHPARLPGEHRRLHRGQDRGPGLLFLAGREGLGPGDPRRPGGPGAGRAQGRGHDRRAP